MTGPPAETRLHKWLAEHHADVELFFASGAFLACVVGAIFEQEHSWPALAALMALNWLLRVFP